MSVADWVFVRSYYILEVQLLLKFLEGVHQPCEGSYVFILPDPVFAWPVGAPLEVSQTLQ